MVPPVVTEFKGPTLRLSDGSMLGIPEDVLQQMDQLDIHVDTIKLVQGDPEGVTMMRDAAKRALELYGLLDTERLSAKRPHLDECKTIDEFCAPFLKRMKTSQDRAKAKLLQFQRDCEEAVRKAEEMRKHAEEMARTAPPAPGRIVPPLLPARDTLELPDVPTTTIRELDIYDSAQIPRMYLMVDRQAILRDLRQGATIPGARMVEVKRIVTR